MKIETSSGFKLTLDKDRLENYELFEAIAEEEAGDTSAAIKIVNLLLGDDAKRLKEHCRNEKGTVPIATIMGELKDIFDKVKELKN